jgi:hypothetical protein
MLYENDDTYNDDIHSILSFTPLQHRLHYTTNFIKFTATPSEKMLNGLDTDDTYTAQSSLYYIDDTVKPSSVYIEILCHRIRVTEFVYNISTCASMGCMAWSHSASSKYTV